MLEYLTLIGLLFIAAGWMAQYLAQYKGKREIVPLLPLLNVIGIFLLVIGAYLSNAMEVLVGNVITLICSALVLLTLKK
jgi:hypothetical protein